MKYSGIDLHSNNSVVTVTDEEDRVVAEKRLPNDLTKIVGLLMPWREEMAGVTVVVMTEFGRRVAENASFGTDHGRGSMMLVLGDGAEGGRVRARWPGLESKLLDGPGDVPVTTDYREVLAPLLARHGARAVARIFPGWPGLPAVA